MNKHFFRRFERGGSWHSAARAFAMLGVVAAHPQLGLERFRLDERLNFGGLSSGGLLRFGFSPRDRAALEQFDALWPMWIDSLAMSWESLIAKLGRPRIEIAQHDENPEVLAYFTELLSQEFLGAASVHIRAGEPRLERPLTWPLEVITQSSQRQRIEALREDLSGGDELVRWLPLDSETTGHMVLVPSDISFVPGSPGHHASEIPSSAIALAFVPERKSAAGAMALGLKLRYRLDTDAVLVVRTPVQKCDEFWLALLCELSGGRALDEAVLLASRSRAVPFLLSSWEFLAKAKLEARGEESAARELLRLSEAMKDRFELGDLAVPESLARSLGLESLELSAPELASALQRFLSEPVGERRPSLSAVFGQLRHAMRSAEKSLDVALSQNLTSPPAERQKPARKPQPRYLQANIISTEGGDAVHEPGALLAGRTYEAEVHIGPVRSGSRFVWKPFPEKDLPSSPAGHELTIVFADISGGRESLPPQLARIYLGPDGASTHCSFKFVTPSSERVGASGGRFSARIAVLYRNRVLQTALISAPVVSSVDARAQVGRGVEQDMELPPVLPDESLGERTPFDAALVLNHGATGAAGAMLVENDNVRWIDIDQSDLDELIHQLRARLDTLTQTDDRPTGLDDGRLVKLLIALANQGGLLWSMVIDQPGIGPGLRQGRRLQVLEARSGTFLPMEFFYEFPPPHPEAQLCPNARQALETGECDHACHRNEVLAEDYVCPAGFWGLTRVLERQRVLDSVHARADVGLKLMPRREERTIPLLLKGLVGASHRVDNHDAGSMDKVRHVLMTLWPDCTQEVKGWKEWATAVQQHAPSLLLLLVHTGREESTDVATIEIADEALAVSRLHERHVRQKDSAGGVLVLLLGCSPVLPTVKFQSVVGRFLWAGRGSAVVVSSIANMLGRHAGPTTAELLTGLGELVRHGTVDVGEAFVRLRRKLLADGDPLMLGLVVYGDVDWYLVAPAS
ncbi:hypothetical protein [Myxococcus fulvus]|uniref:hypothetical protein n=1 Tax=Myxococcus fulvus TaxID=33 RepID=UPI0020BD62B6|nr:hypothetical protein [Myxococcus fulvus]MCK8498032.1 hypothetical protein [Myxococcus fulvus]